MFSSVVLPLPDGPEHDPNPRADPNETSGECDDVMVADVVRAADVLQTDQRFRRRLGAVAAVGQDGTVMAGTYAAAEPTASGLVPSRVGVSYGRGRIAGRRDERARAASQTIAERAAAPPVRSSAPE